VWNESLKYEPMNAQGIPTEKGINRVLARLDVSTCRRTAGAYFSRKRKLQRACRIAWPVKGCSAVSYSTVHALKSSTNDFIYHRHLTISKHLNCKVVPRQFSGVCLPYLYFCKTCNHCLMRLLSSVGQFVHMNFEHFERRKP